MKSRGGNFAGTDFLKKQKRYGFTYGKWLSYATLPTVQAAGAGTAAVLWRQYFGYSASEALEWPMQCYHGCCAGSGSGSQVSAEAKMRSVCRGFCQRNFGEMAVQCSAGSGGGYVPFEDAVNFWSNHLMNSLDLKHLFR
ncbi:hypothetical protein NPIL_168781 [Nephila pilipes]|uniref:Uncharacterized protein n=1 Tax=Nephila pilipes TaxID=299642 RepID=A0A8X6NX58_NEPPI|nr:hypothetical protein NPIL_168781 [Nephila pilipes]